MPTEKIGMDNSEGFDPQLINKLLYQWTEGYRLDYKFTFYSLDNEDELFKFIKHSIAFANIARRTGKHCFMVFGVRDDDFTLHDIRGDFPKKKIPPWWNEKKTPIRKKQLDGVLREFQNVYKLFVAPEIQISYDFGIFRDNFISYITFFPSYPKQPYSLKKPIKGKPQGSIFIRNGANSISIDPLESIHLLSISEAIYFESNHWKQLLTYYMSGDFLRNYTLVPIYHSKVKSTNQHAEKYILSRITSEKPYIAIITAPAGDGKTVLLNRLAYSIANLHNISIISNYKNYQSAQAFDDEFIHKVGEELEYIPTHPIPIYFPLRTCFSKIETLEKQILKQVIKTIDDKEYSNLLIRLDQLYKIPNTRWVFLLDGIDELSNRTTAGKILREWLNTLPSNVSVIMTSRPYAVEGLTDFEQVSLAQLKDDEILYLIEGKIRSKGQNPSHLLTTEIKSIIQTVEWREFLFRHRAIDGFVEYIIEKSIIPTSMIDNRNFDGGFEVSDYYSVNKSQSKDIDQIPLISMNELVGDGTLLPDDQSIDEKAISSNIGNPEDELLPFLKIIALQRTIDHISSEEIKRNAGLGTEEIENAEKARYQLGLLAWNSDWLKNGIDYIQIKPKISMKSIKWNEYVGYIKRRDFPIYEFANFLTRAYFLVFFAFYHLGNEKIIIDRFRETTIDLIKLSKELYVELCTINGRQTAIDHGG